LTLSTTKFKGKMREASAISAQLRTEKNALYPVESFGEPVCFLFYNITFK